MFNHFAIGRNGPPFVRQNNIAGRIFDRCIKNGSPDRCPFVEAREDFEQPDVLLLRVFQAIIDVSIIELIPRITERKYIVKILVEEWHVYCFSEPAQRPRISQTRGNRFHGTYLPPNSRIGNKWTIASRFDVLQYPVKLDSSTPN